MNYKKEAINLSGKKLTTFPTEIFETRKLHKLNLSNNNLKEIPKEISELTRLETLDLSGNQIRHLYAKLFDLPNLKILILNNNEIISVPKQIEKLKRLKVLDLANNKLSKLPDELSNLEALEELNLSSNFINDIRLTGDLPFVSLRALWIAHNPLTNITAKKILSDFIFLKSLYLFSPKMVNPLVSNDPLITAASLFKGNCLTYLKELIKEPKKDAKSPVQQIYTFKMKAAIVNKPASIFISYAHEDLEYLEKLKRHLRVLQRDVKIDIWDDGKIKTSENWQEVIQKALNAASDAILLISTDFLASDFILDNELPVLLENARLTGTRIHPVIVHPCQFLKVKSLRKFQAANSPDEPLSELPHPKQERVWMKLCNDIQSFLEG